MRILSLLALLSLSQPLLAARDWLWFEAEAVNRSDFPPKSVLNPTADTQKALLSNGGWLAHEAGEPGGTFARYTLMVPTAGQYHVWTRGVLGRPFRWHIDSRARVESTSAGAPMDPVRVPLDGGRVLEGAWRELGSIELTEGPHIFELELAKGEPGEQPGPLAFDCFLFTPKSFVPNGTTKPE